MKHPTATLSLAAWAAERELTLAFEQRKKAHRTLARAEQRVTEALCQRRLVRKAEQEGQS